MTGHAAPELHLDMFLGQVVPDTRVLQGLRRYPTPTALRDVFDNATHIQGLVSGLDYREVKGLRHLAKQPALRAYHLVLACIQAARPTIWTRGPRTTLPAWRRGSPYTRMRIIPPPVLRPVGDPLLRRYLARERVENRAKQELEMAEGILSNETAIPWDRAQILYGLITGAASADVTKALH